MKKLFNITAILFFTAALFLCNHSFGQNFRTGMLFDDEQYQNSEQKAVLTRSLYTKIPSKHSLKQYAPEAKTQGNYGTCVGWATAYAALTIAESIETNRTNTTEITNEAFSPGFIYQLIKSPNDPNCSYGAHINNALETMKNKGAAKYHAIPEVNCPKNIDNEIFNDAANYRVESYARIFGLYDNDNFKISATKKSLSENKPVIMGMNVPPSFYNAKNVWQPTEEKTGRYYGHAMCIVGYDDDLHGGVFEVMNSWGNHWGNEGFIYIKYSDFTDFTRYAYEISAIKSSAQSKTKLAGSIRLQGADGIEFPVTKKDNTYKVNKEIPTGSLFRIYIRNTEPAYVYCFGFDSTEKIFPIFPHKQISPYLSYNTNEVAIPDEQHYIQTDDTEGTNYLCILLSKKPINTEKLYKVIESAQGSFYKRINSSLNDKLFAVSDLNFDSQTASFHGESSDKTAAFIILEAKHVK